MSKQMQNDAPSLFNRWVDANYALPPGQYTHEQLRELLWRAWSAACNRLEVENRRLHEEMARLQLDITLRDDEAQY
jgi:hypothetical protein